MEIKIEKQEPKLLKDLKLRSVVGMAVKTPGGHVAVITDIDYSKNGCGGYSALIVVDIDGIPYCRLTTLFPDNELYEVSQFNKIENVVALKF